MKTIILWCLNWILKNASVSLHTSDFAEGTRIDGHDIPSLKDKYIIVDIDVAGKHWFKGFWQFS